jgi:hypothetical protein
MSEKIYTRLLRLYPSRFRKEYEAEALQLIRDRLRDERGFFKRARLWWDLVADVLAGLPSAYRNSYAVTESASLSFNAAGIPSFKVLDEEPLGRGSILLGGTISLVVLAAFAFLLSRPIAYRSLPSSNGRMSPIESVMQRLNQPPAPDSAESSLQDAATPPAALMSEPPGASTLGASSKADKQAGSDVDLQDAAAPPSALMSEPQAQPSGASTLQAFSKGGKQARFAADGQSFAIGSTAGMRSMSHDSQPVAGPGQTPIPTGQPPLDHAARASIQLPQTQDIADTWQGTLHAGKDLRAVIKITKANAGGYKAAFYSLDQSGTPFPVTKITLEGSTVKYSIPAFDLTYEGKLSGDGKTIVGTSNQGTRSLPLTFTRATPETAWAIPQARP